jgi:uncharacterized Zn-finger protein
MPIDPPETVPPETVQVETADVACDGNGGVGGHPRVFLAIGKEGFVDCPYCDRRFVLKNGVKVGAH